MPATWSDFTYVNAASGTSEGTLSISNVQPGDLIIAVSSARRAYGPGVAPPIHTPGGVSTEVVHEQNTLPAEIYPQRGWDWWWYPYWPFWWLYWYPYSWDYYAYRSVSRVSIYKAANSGTVSVTFQRGYPGSPIFQTYLCVWRPNISVGQNETIVNVTYAPSAQSAQYSPYTLSMPVRTDELLLATAKGLNVSALSPSLSGVTVQNLVNYSAVYGNCRHTVQLWRIKTTGTAVYTPVGANVAQQLTKIIPNVEVAHVSVPSVPPEANYFYVEFGADLLSTGRVIRPRWFETIRSSYAWDNNLGLRKRWVKGTAIGDDRGRARVVELWKVPKGAENSIPAGEAYVFTTDQDAEARVLFHDLGW